MAIVSVILPVYNGEKYIKESVESVLHQTFKDFSLYVIDDGSTDNTISVLEKFNDKRLKIVRNEKNQGLIYTLNKGLELSSSSKYIARMDADDISIPNRLEVQCKFMDENPQIGLLGTAMEQFGDNIQSKKIFRPKTENRIISTFMFYNPLSHPTVMLRSEKLEQKYSYDFPKYEDYHLWISVCKEMRIYNLNEILLKYRRHSSNVTTTYFDDTLLDHSYIQKLIQLFAEQMSIDLTSEEKSVLSIISTKVRYQLNSGYSLKYLYSIHDSILSKLNSCFDKFYFSYLFQERAFLYFISLKRYNDSLLILAKMKFKNKSKFISSYLNGKK